MRIADVFVFTNQPATCPQCGLRTLIVFEGYHDGEYRQTHLCPSQSCANHFDLVEDQDFDDGSLE